MSYSLVLLVETREIVMRDYCRAIYKRLFIAQCLGSAGWRCVVESGQISFLLEKVV